MQAKRIRILKGDVFSVPLENGRVGHVQYIADDDRMLDSWVIRAFRGDHAPDAAPAPSVIAAGEVAFHTHVFLRWGVKYFGWLKIGKAPFPETVDVLFCNTWDVPIWSDTVSTRWHVWRANEPERPIGALSTDYRHAELGIVCPPQAISERILTGENPLAPLFLSPPVAAFHRLRNRLAGKTEGPPVPPRP